MRALSTPRRREILRLCWDRERSAGELHRAFDDVTPGAISQHLRVLEAANLVTARPDGRHRFYLARKAELGPLREWLESMWGAALSRLTLLAELEAARRGPRGRRRAHRTTKSTNNQTKTTPTKNNRPRHRR